MYIYVCALLAKANQKQKKKTKTTNWNRLGEHISIYVFMPRWFFNLYIYSQNKVGQTTLILSYQQITNFTSSKKCACNNQSNAKKRFLDRSIYHIYHSTFHQFFIWRRTYSYVVWERYMCVISSHSWSLGLFNHDICLHMHQSIKRRKIHGEIIHGEIRGNNKKINTIYMLLFRKLIKPFLEIIIAS